MLSLYSSTSFSKDFSRLFPSFAPVFTSHLLSGSITAMPTARQRMPTGKNEKKDRPLYPASRRVSSITRLGGVPMSVSIPPMLLANAKGMSSLEGLFLLSMDMDTMMGIISATVPVLLTNAPMRAVTVTTSRNVAVSLLPARCMILWLAALASPVCSMAPPTTNSPTIMMTTGLENPESASAGDNIPQRIRIVRAQSATISALILPVTNRVTVARRTRIVMIIIKVPFGV